MIISSLSIQLALIISIPKERKANWPRRYLYSEREVGRNTCLAFYDPITIPSSHWFFFVIAFFITYMDLNIERGPQGQIRVRGKSIRSTAGRNRYLTYQSRRWRNLNSDRKNRGSTAKQFAPRAKFSTILPVFFCYYWSNLVAVVGYPQF